MRGWSLPAGRFFGVEVRLHAFFLLLLAMAVAFGALAGTSPARVLALWLLLLFAVVVREIARSLAAAWLGLDLRGILLLPTGGLLSWGTLDSAERANTPEIERPMALAGPIASIAFGLLLAGIILASAPGVSVTARPWIAPTHLLRAAVWMNFMLGVINLLPAFPLDGGRLMRSGGYVAGAPDGKERRRSPAPRRPFGFSLRSGVALWLAVALVIGGLLMPNLWLLLLGGFLLIGAQVDSAGLAQPEAGEVRMRDIMLTQFSTLSASDTLEDALQRAVHTMQDVFPVVRGATLVGSVSRQNLLEALAAHGNSYVQGVMQRSFQTAQPDDSLVKTLRRIMGQQGAQLVPVMEGERIVGIVTPQNLSQSMGLLNQSRRFRRLEDED
jgi:Zn-dependent protease/CBS domain-containing protein